MENEQEILLQKIEAVLDQLPTWQKDIIYLDIHNHYEERDNLLKENVGISSQVEINRYVQRLREKIRDMANGVWKPKHQNTDKPTLKGF